jgi:N-hydroxyarylamine O-acetyltransferase
LGEGSFKKRKNRRTIILPKAGAERIAMHIDEYLSRVRLNERPAPTLAGLQSLHRAHLTEISYENLDVQLGRPLSTDPEAAYDKIVNRGRGGWCYEMNGVFGWALGELGFDVTRATGAVVRALKGEMAEGNHLVLKVVLHEGTYLADVGFGDGPRDPIHVVAGPFHSHGFDFGLERINDDWWRLANHAKGSAPSFDFNLARADESLFAQKCVMLQTSPQSPFVQNLIAQRHTDYGVAILRGRVLRKVRPGLVEDSIIDSAKELSATLQTVFGLNVPEAESLWPKICARHDEVLAQQNNSAAAH